MLSGAAWCKPLELLHVGFRPVRCSSLGLLRVALDSAWGCWVGLLRDITEATLNGLKKLEWNKSSLKAEVELFGFQQCPATKTTQVDVSTHYSVH